MKYQQIIEGVCRMKKGKRLLSASIITAMLVPLMAITTWASPTSGFSLVPFANEEDWEVQMGDNDYAPLNSEGCWVKTTVDNNALVIQRTAECSKDILWPRIRTLQLEKPPEFDLKENPYLYYDFTAEGAQWAIHIRFGNNPNSVINCAQEITNAAGMPALESMQSDGNPGTYKGKIDMNKVLKDNKILGVTPEGKTSLGQVNIYIIDPGTAGKLTVRQLSIGNEKAGGDNSNATPKPEATPTPTPEATPTPTPTPEATPTPTPEETKTPSPTPEATPTPEVTPDVPASGDVEENDGGSALPFIIIGVIVVLAAAGGVWYFIARKKK